MIKLKSPTLLFIILWSVPARLFFVILILAGGFNISFSQAPAVEWQNTIGSNNLDYLKKAINCADGGFLLMGNTFTGAGIPSGDKSESGFGKDDGWVIKTDATGTIEWENTIGGSGADYFADAVGTTDGGFMLAGWSFSPVSGEKTAARIGESDYWIVKINSEGVIEWQQTYGGNNSDQLSEIENTTDGGFILGGISYSGASGNKSEPLMGANDFWIVKINAAGIIEWENTIGGNNYEFFKQIHQTPDGGFILCGTSKSEISGDKTEATVGGTGNDDTWVLKLDAEGNILWQNTIGGFSIDGAADISLTGDGGFIVLSGSNSGIGGDKTTSAVGGYDYWLIKLNSLGSIEWNQTIGGTSDEFVNSVQQTSDEGYLIGGYSLSGISGNKTEMNLGLHDYWIVKTDAAGNLIWENTIGGNNSDRLANALQSQDDGFFLAGYSSSPVSADKTEASASTDFWIVKLLPEECAIPGGLYADNITSVKATAHWDLNPGALSYQLWYRATGAVSWIKKSSTVNFKTIKSLTPETEYEYKVRTKCSDGLYGEFSPVQNFTTLPLRQENLINENSIFLYPNPANDKLHIQINSQLLSPFSFLLTITDLEGRIIFTSELNSLSTEIHISEFASGMYFVKVVPIDNGREIQMIEKFIKN